MKDDRLYLIHIRECIDRIESYLEEDPIRFIEDQKTQDAVVRNLQIMAESTQRLSDEVKSMSPSTDWQALSGFRNVLVHDYLGIDVARVHSFLSTKVRELRDEIELISNRLGLPPSP